MMKRIALRRENEENKPIEENTSIAIRLTCKPGINPVKHPARLQAKFLETNSSKFEKTCLYTSRRLNRKEFEEN